MTGRDKTRTGRDRDDPPADGGRRRHQRRRHARDGPRAARRRAVGPDRRDPVPARERRRPERQGQARLHAARDRDSATPAASASTAAPAWCRRKPPRRSARWAAATARPFPAHRPAARAALPRARPIRRTRISRSATCRGIRLQPDWAGSVARSEAAGGRWQPERQPIADGSQWPCRCGRLQTRVDKASSLDLCGSPVI